MKKKIKILVIAILVIFLVIVIISNYHKKNFHEIKSDLGLRLISNNIIQLEGAIKYQIDNNWTDHNHVIEKIDDVIESIYITQLVASKLNELSSGEKEVLTKLAVFFESFPKYSGFPNSEINEIEVQRFEELRDNLREVSWGMEINYSSDWNELIKKAEDLMNSR